MTAAHFRVEGAQAVLSRAGDAALKIGAHEVVRWAKPRAYQQGSNATPVAPYYFLHYGRLSFAVDHYDQLQSQLRLQRRRELYVFRCSSQFEMLRNSQLSQHQRHVGRRSYC